MNSRSTRGRGGLCHLQEEPAIHPTLTQPTHRPTRDSDTTEAFLTWSRNKRAYDHGPSWLGTPFLPGRRTRPTDTGVLRHAPPPPRICARNLSQLQQQQQLEPGCPGVERPVGQSNYQRGQLRLILRGITVVARVEDLLWRRLLQTMLRPAGARRLIALQINSQPPVQVPLFHVQIRRPRHPGRCRCLELVSPDPPLFLLSDKYLIGAADRLLHKLCAALVLCSFQLLVIWTGFSAARHHPPSDVASPLSTDTSASFIPFARLNEFSIS
jgi:hypothetical protein